MTALISAENGSDGSILGVGRSDLAAVFNGLARLSDGRRRCDLESAWQHVLRLYSTSVLTFGLEAGRATAEVLSDAERAGRPISFADAQIAGICRAGGYDLATRNTADFDGLGLNVTDPFVSTD